MEIVPYIMLKEIIENIKDLGHLLSYMDINYQNIKTRDITMNINFLPYKNREKI